MVRRTDKARFWRDDFDLVKDDLYKHPKLEQKDHKPRKGILLSTVAAQADRAKGKRRRK